MHDCQALRLQFVGLLGAGEVGEWSVPTTTARRRIKTIRPYVMLPRQDAQPDRIRYTAWAALAASVTKHGGTKSFWVVRCANASGGLKEQQTRAHTSEIKANSADTSRNSTCEGHPYIARPGQAMPCHAMPCHAMPCHAMPCHTTPRHATPYHKHVIAWYR